ncbi:unnamed protein product, partial [Ilex paraguariensis]
MYAISVKETQLIGNVALGLEVGREDVSIPIRIVSPREPVTGNSDENKDIDPNTLKLSGDQEFQVNAQSQADPPAANEPDNLKELSVEGIWNEPGTPHSLNGISSYEEFLEHLDQQLNKMEAELATVLRFSTLVLEGDEKPKNSKLQQTVEILGGIRGIRG